MKSIYSPEYRALLAWLRASRISLNLSLREVAARIGTPHTWVGKIETGERRLDVSEYVRLCHALGLDPRQGIANIEAVLNRYPRAAEPKLKPPVRPKRPHP